MSVSITRRSALVLTTLAVLSTWLLKASAESSRTEIEDQIRALEHRSGGRLGVGILYTASGQLLGSRLNERFAMCSTFKFLAVALTLARVDKGEEKIDRRIYFSRNDLVMPYKATEPHLTDGMTIEQLCEAALFYSDSTAANMLLASFGGPSALNNYLRDMGDDATILSNYEPTLNIVKTGETNNTTTPHAMVEDLKKILLGDALSVSSRNLLTNWMINSKDVAAQRLRVGLPEGWRIANKPGTWKGISTNDIGVIFPPHGDPIIIAAYLGEALGSIPDQEATLADVARIAIRGQ